jgi:hypothetical protein
VIQAKLVSANVYEGITVKMLGQAMNYYGNDFRGTALALLDIGNKHAGSDEHYDLGVGRAPVLTMATTKSIIIRFSQSTDGVSIPINDTSAVLSSSNSNILVNQTRSRHNIHSVQIDKEPVILGAFDTEEEARAAYFDAVEKYLLLP